MNALNALKARRWSRGHEEERKTDLPTTFACPMPRRGELTTCLSRPCGRRVALCLGERVCINGSEEPYPRAILSYRTKFGLRNVSGANQSLRSMPIECINHAVQRNRCTFQRQSQPCQAPTTLGQDDEWWGGLFLGTHSPGRRHPDDSCNNNISNRFFQGCPSRW